MIFITTVFSVLSPFLTKIRSGTMRVRIALKCAALLDLGLFSSHQESLTLSLDQLHNATLYGEPRDMLGDIRAAYWFDTVVRLSMHKSAALRRGFRAHCLRRHQRRCA